METFTIDGEGPKKGQIFKNKDLANTFRLLAKEGNDAFYKGEIAEKIDDWMKKMGVICDMRISLIMNRNGSNLKQLITEVMTYFK